MIVKEGNLYGVRILIHVYIFIFESYVSVRICFTCTYITLE